MLRGGGRARRRRAGADGIDEVLEAMLAGDWASDPQPDLTGTVDVAAGNSGMARRDDTC